MKNEINLKDSLNTLKICMFGGLGLYLFCYIFNGTMTHYLLLTIVYMFFMLIMTYSTICDITKEIEQIKELKK